MLWVLVAVLAFGLYDSEGDGNIHDGVRRRFALLSLLVGADRGIATGGAHDGGVVCFSSIWFGRSNAMFCDKKRCKVTAGD